MARVEAVIGEIPYAVTITAGPYGLISDGDRALGGWAAGPTPYDLVLAALGACTALTLKIKAWSLVAARITLQLARKEGALRVDRSIILEGDLDETQRARLADVAERGPATLTLKQGLTILTTLIAR